MKMNSSQEALLREIIRNELNEISFSGAADFLKKRLGFDKEKPERQILVGQLISDFRKEISKDVESIELIYQESLSAGKDAGSDLVYSLNSFMHALNILEKKLMKVLGFSSDKDDNGPIVKQRLKMLRLGKLDGEKIVNDAFDSINKIKKRIKSWKNINLAKEKSIFKKDSENEIISDMNNLNLLKRLAKEGKLGVIKYYDV